MSVARRRPAVLMICLVLAAAARAAADGAFVPTPRLNLPVEAVRPAFAPYAEFCAREAGACDLSGPQSLRLTPERMALIEAVNRAVNRGIVLMTDALQYGVEEFWTYPRSGYGDCEDL
ncbi:MAG: transglutaminase-like cysteine peptidase, partial [Gammaproteobacteria bacterium]|nr:transglutaminase-like cysteine peptidase [Gammaproteobacteria bacterium]